MTLYAKIYATSTLLLNMLEEADANTKTARGIKHHTKGLIAELDNFGKLTATGAELNDLVTHLELKLEEGLEVDAVV